MSECLPLINRTGGPLYHELSDDILPLCKLKTLDEVLAFGAALERSFSFVNVIQQDEFSQDVIIRMCPPFHLVLSVT